MSDESVGSPAASTDDGGAPVPRLVLGVVVSPQLAPTVRREITEGFPHQLRNRMPGVDWQVVVVEDRLLDPPVDQLELLEAARDRMLDEEWDLVVVLTDFLLKHHKKTVLTEVSPVHGVGLVSVPALGAVRVREKVRETTVRLIGTLLGYDPDDASSQVELARTAQQRSTDLDSHAEENAAQFTARVIGGNFHLLLGLIRANRPWLLAVSLSRALTAAAATAVIALVTSDLWLLATAYGAFRLTALGLLAVGAVSATLVVGAGLWERPRRREEREQVILFNLATTTTVVIGMLTFYAALFFLSLLAGLLLVDAGVFAGVVGGPVGILEYVKLALLTTALATVGGALGAGLEDDAVVRAAAFTRRET